MRTALKIQDVAEAIHTGVPPRTGHYHHRVYGQRVCSNVILPGLNPGEFATTASIKFVRRPDRVMDGSEISRAFAVRRFTTNVGCDLVVAESELGFILYWVGRALFTVSSDGANIECTVEPGVRFPWVLTLLYATVLSFALHLRHVPNLHAGGLIISSGATAFLASPGTGKSTLTAILAATGAPILTDDILALTRSNDHYLAHAGFPSVSLAREAARVVLDDNAYASYCAESTNEKSRVVVDGVWARFANTAAPLRSLFILKRGQPDTDPQFERLNTSSATRGVLENTVPIAFLPRHALENYFSFAARIGSTVGAYSLTVPGSLERLAELAPRLIDEIEELTRE